jgi:hypothetical protein
MLEYWDRMQPERSLALLSADEDGRTSEVKPGPEFAAG